MPVLRLMWSISHSATWLGIAAVLVRRGTVPPSAGLTAPFVRPVGAESTGFGPRLAACPRPSRSRGPDGERNWAQQQLTLCGHGAGPAWPPHEKGKVFRPENAGPAGDGHDDVGAHNCFIATWRVEPIDMRPKALHRIQFDDADLGVRRARFRRCSSKSVVGPPNTVTPRSRRYWTAVDCVVFRLPVATTWAPPRCKVSKSATVLGSK